MLILSFVIHLWKNQGFYQAKVNFFSTKVVLSLNLVSTIKNNGRMDNIQSKLNWKEDWNVWNVLHSIFFDIEQDGYNIEYKRY